MIYVLIILIIFFILLVIHSYLVIDISRYTIKDKRIDKAFRHMGEDPADEERFDSYVRGGVDVLYEKLIEGATDPEDYINKPCHFLNLLSSNILL